MAKLKITKFPSFFLSCYKRIKNEPGFWFNVDFFFDIICVIVDFDFRILRTVLSLDSNVPFGAVTGPAHPGRIWRGCGGGPLIATRQRGWGGWGHASFWPFTPHAHQRVSRQLLQWVALNHTDHTSCCVISNGNQVSSHCVGHQGKNVYLICIKSWQSVLFINIVHWTVHNWRMKILTAWVVD